MNDNKKLMLFFECGDDQYAVSCRDVVEVIPNIQTKGAVEYHGKKVPVVDFTAIQTGRSSHPALSTRIILLNTGKDSVTGLTAEKVLRTESFPEEAFIKSGSSKDLSNHQIVTEEANVPVIDPAKIMAAATKGKKK
jgi:chemotaxis signal transduction protein